MEECDISLARSDATADQIDAIKRRRASGNAGPICVIGNVQRPANHGHADDHSSWLHYLAHWLRLDCD